MTALGDGFRTSARPKRRRHKIYSCRRCGCEVDLFGYATPLKCHSGCISYGFLVVQRGHDARTWPLRRGSLRSCVSQYLSPGVSGEGDS